MAPGVFENILNKKLQFLCIQKIVLVGVHQEFYNPNEVPDQTTQVLLISI